MLASEPAYEAWMDAIEWPYSYEAADEMSDDDVLMFAPGWQCGPGDEDDGSEDSGDAGWDGDDSGVWESNDVS